MKTKLQAKGLSHIQIESAGIATIDGLGPTEETIKVMAEKKIDVSFHHARLLTKEMIEKADLILAMTDIHQNAILEHVPEAKKKVHLLKNYGDKSERGESIQIPDPIGRPVESYEVCRDVIEEAVDKVIEQITDR